MKLDGVTVAAKGGDCMTLVDGLKCGYGRLSCLFKLSSYLLVFNTPAVLNMSICCWVVVRLTLSNLFAGMRAISQLKS